MKFKIVSSFLVLNLLTILFSNAQNGYFAKIYTSIQSVQIYDLLETKDNCFLMVGEKDGEAFIQKIDSVGQPLWQRKIGNNFNERFTSIAEANDSIYVAAGRYYNNPANLDILITKINLNGYILSNRIIDFGFSEEATYISKTKDSGFVISAMAHNIGGGTPYEKISVVKLDSGLNIKWGKLYSYGTNADIPYFVKSANDSSLIVGTYSENYPPFDGNGALLFLDNNGNSLWSKKYQTGNNWSMFRDCYVDSTGITGLIESSVSKFYIVKTDFNGNVFWVKSYSGVILNNVLNEPYTRLTPCKDKGFLIVGKENLIRIDSTGNLLWYRSPFLYNSKTIECKNGDLLIAGNGPMIGVTQTTTLDPHVGIIRSDSLGNGPSCIQNFNPINVSNDTIFTQPIAFSTSGTANISVITIPIDSTSLVFTNGCVDFYGGVQSIIKHPSITLFPNPASEIIRFTSSTQELHDRAEITICDLSEREIKKLNLSAEELEKGIHIQELNEGYYIIKIRSANLTFSTHLIICR